MPYILLTLSIVLSSGRNLLSKNLSAAEFGTRRFFVRQAVLFASGALALLLFGGIEAKMPSLTTFAVAVIYAILLIFAQWFYTVALGGGNTALCSTVYSMGFILPTLSGALFFSESLTILNTCGILSAAAAVICSSDFSKKEKTGARRYFPALLTAMLASGGLGIMQKVQQSSEYASERGAFLLIAFITAALISALGAMLAKSDGESETCTTHLTAAGVGIAFGSCNLLNTALAGMLPSAVFFPTLNIGTVLLTGLCGIFFFREKLGRKDITVLAFGAISILLLNIK